MPEITEADRVKMTAQEIGAACIEWCGRNGRLTRGIAYTADIHVYDGTLTAEVYEAPPTTANPVKKD